MVVGGLDDGLGGQDWADDGLGAQGWVDNTLGGWSWVDDKLELAVIWNERSQITVEFLLC